MTPQPSSDALLPAEGVAKPQRAPRYARPEPQWEIALTEAHFQSQVTQYATLMGWKWMHIRPGLNERGRYRTPVSGSLGSGWPDLVLCRNERILFVELKAQKGKPTGLQSEVLGVLGLIPCAEVYVWRPSDWNDLQELLK